MSTKDLFMLPNKDKEGSMDDDSYVKWYLPLSLHYVHFGNPKDFPIRLIVTPSSHFRTGGVDVDVVLNKEDLVIPKTSSDDHEDDGKERVSHKGMRFFFVKTYLVLKFDVIRDHHSHQNQDPQYHAHHLPSRVFHLLSKKASITVNVACRMFNSYGRGCWRDGGVCHVSLLELLNNARLSTLDKILFTTRKIYNSGYSVSQEDRLTGIISLSSYGDYSSLREKDLVYCLGADEEVGKWKSIVFCIHENNPKSILSGLFVRKKPMGNDTDGQSSTVAIFSTKDLIRFLFGVVVEAPEVDSMKDGAFSPGLVEYLERDSPFKRKEGDPRGETNVNRVRSEELIKKVEKEWSRYKTMVDGIFLDFVEIDVMNTKRMKCPWTPMDTTVFECYSDYSNDYILQDRRRQPQQQTKEKFDGLYNVLEELNTQGGNLEQLILGKEGLRTSFSSVGLGATSTFYPSTVCFHHYETVMMNVEYSKCNIWLFKENDYDFLDYPPIGSKNKQCQGELEKYRRIDSFVEELNKIDGEKSKKRTYLPFFAYIIHQPLVVYKNYWGIALNILISRNSHLYTSYEDFETKFFDDRVTSNSERARLSFQLVCGYPQALEYISDYYMTKKKKEPFEAETYGSEDEDPQKIEIEQFWNSLRSMCGDCDDLSFAILQFYYNFVKTKRGSSFAFVQNNKVLKEMRRMLEDNYILLYQIEGVYLAKQTAGGETGLNSMYDKLRPSDVRLLQTTPYVKLPKYLRDIIDEYYPDVADMNSAHAAIKLLPKLYFERCVNRSYEVLNSKRATRLKNPFRHHYTKSTLSNEKISRESKSCREGGAYTCKYHLNPPDAYNDELPVLVGEGTSMLNCGSDAKDPCKEQVFKDYVLSDDLINDVAKVPIYAKKGESDFYKASLFGACLDFLDAENVATFTYCRENSSLQGTGDNPFLRGVSHKQLSFKSEKVILLPYGHSPIPNKSKTNYALKEIPQHTCRHLCFAYPEMSSFMKHLCISECKKRIRPRKLQIRRSLLKDSNDFDGVLMDPMRFEWWKEGNKRKTNQKKMMGLLNVGGPRFKVYNMQSFDTRWKIQTGFDILRDWCSRMNAKHDDRDVMVKYGGRFKDTSLSPVEKDGGFFTMFLDNFYVTVDFLNHLEQKIAPKCPIRFETNFALEVHSEDVVLWKIQFNLKTILH